MSIEWLKAQFASPGVGVDREAKRVNGYVMAQEGPFKTKGRGEFDLKSLKQIVALANKQPAGLKCRFCHPNLSSDGLGKFLGRTKNVRLDQVRLKRNGEEVLLNAVRGDLILDDSSFSTPHGDLGSYVLNLAENDSDALSSSLVLQANQELRMDAKTKRPQLADDGSELPPLWRPTKLHASDLCDEGDACDGLLSFGIDISTLPDNYVRLGTDLLNQAFPDKSREEMHSIMSGFQDNYLLGRYGAADVKPEQPKAKPATLSIEEARRRLWMIENG